jgi:hypothetical protein
MTGIREYKLQNEILFIRGFLGYELVWWLGINFSEEHPVSVFGGISDVDPEMLIATHCIYIYIYIYIT